MKKVFSWPKYLKKAPFHYCPGCGHSIVHRLIAELLDEMGLGEKTIGVAPAGCAVLAYDYFDFDVTEAAHGRGVAVATGIKRCLPKNLVFSYQGDGDLAAIGTAETIHAANRGERITVIFINNAVYGMTGGQLAPTTLVGQKTTTSPRGRDAIQDGYTLHMSEVLAVIRGSAYIERVAVNSPKNIIKTKKAIKNAFLTQMEDAGFSMVEVLSPCPTNWKMGAYDAFRWVDEVMAKEFPPGILADRRGKNRTAKQQIKK